MKNKIFILLGIAFLSQLLTVYANKNEDNSKSLFKVNFKENLGQITDQNYKPRPDILFSGTDGNLFYHLKNNGVSYQLLRVDKWEKEEQLHGQYPFVNSTTNVNTVTKDSSLQKFPSEITIYRLDINWINSNTTPTIKKGNLINGVENFYTNASPNGVINVKSYDNVIYQQVYKGIDLKWYQKNGQLEYDYVVSANADYKQIKLQIEGAETVSVNKKGQLVIETPLGEIIEKAPVVLQNGKVLVSNWVVNENIVSFNIENINNNQPFTIDPTVDTRLWGTYYGGPATAYNANGHGNTYDAHCTTDLAGNVYLSGWTNAHIGTYIATTGSHQAKFDATAGGYARNAYLAKFNSDGVRLWGTYYGGGGDYGNSCATDRLGNVYLTGYTGSSVSIASPGSHQTKLGGLADGFLVKFNSSGARQWATYYGGGETDVINSCTIDTLNNVYVVGYSASTNFGAIATEGSFQTSNNLSYSSGGNYDAFIAKFDSNGTRKWGTYYGYDGQDFGASCATDISGNVYMAGSTNSTFGISSTGAHQLLYGGGLQKERDAFLVKFDSSGGRLWSTYYGGSSFEEANSCAVDTFQNVYLAGTTRSDTANVIATVGSHQPFYGGTSTSYDAFLVKFDKLGVRQWGTYYGGSGDESYLGSTAIATDLSGNVFLVGSTNSTSGISTSNGFLPNYVPTYYQHAYLVKFDGAGARQWGTYLGSDSLGMQYAQSCATDALENIYVAGTSFGDFDNTLGTIGTHQPTLSGLGQDAFLTKFGISCNTFSTTVVSQTAATCGENDAMATLSSEGAKGIYNYLWLPSAATGATVDSLGVGAYDVFVSSGGCRDTIRVDIGSGTTITTTILSQTDASCGNSDGAAKLSSVGASGNFEYSWYPFGGNKATGVNLEAGTYTVYITSNKCISTTTVTIGTGPGKVRVPNAFSPNADDVNDKECVLGVCFGSTDFHFTIYDRWGEKVFESFDPKLCWNGIFNGMPMLKDVYVYYLSVISPSKEVFTQKGNISLIR